MMVADTSALMAVLLQEEEGPNFHDAMLRDGEVLISTATAVELLIVASARGSQIYEDAIQYLRQPFIGLAPVGETEMHAAVRAHQTYGRGRHPAGLAFGDPFAYALASTRGLPLLYKGADFSRTDVTPAAPTTT